MPNHLAYCLFRKASTWLAIPAKVVREVMPRPRLVSIPRTHGILSGMSHIRSAFLPVLNFSVLFPDEHSGNEAFMLIIEDTNGDWGLLVDEVNSLVNLEISHAPEQRRNHWESTVVGWASSGESIVRILDHIQFRELAAMELSPVQQKRERELLLIEDL